MTTREQLTFERMRSLLAMMEQDGATPAGETPRPADLAALQQTGALGDAEQVREAHADRVAPPDFSNNGGTQ